jgi:hypothetical protein
MAGAEVGAGMTRLKSQFGKAAVGCKPQEAEIMP